MLEILFFYCYAKYWRFDQDLNNLSNIIISFIRDPMYSKSYLKNFTFDLIPDATVQFGFDLKINKLWKCLSEDAFVLLILYVVGILSPLMWVCRMGSLYDLSEGDKWLTLRGPCL
jgi:hypothetical protein